MHLHHSQPSSLFSEAATDREVVLQDVPASASGVKIKVKIIPRKTAAPEALAPTERDGEAGSSIPRRAFFQGRREASSSSSSAPSASKKALQDHPHQDPIATRILPTTAPTRPSIASSQRPQWRESPLAPSEHPCLTTPERSTLSTAEPSSLTTLKPADVEASKRGEELRRWQNGLFGAVEMRVDGQEDLDAQAFVGFGDECRELKEDEVGVEEVYGLIGALMPKVE